MRTTYLQLQGVCQQQDCFTAVITEQADQGQLWSWPGWDVVSKSSNPDKMIFWDEGHLSDVRYDLLDVGSREDLKILRREMRSPGIKDLHHLGPGICLHRRRDEQIRNVTISAWVGRHRLFAMRAHSSSLLETNRQNAVTCNVDHHGMPQLSSDSHFIIYDHTREAVSAAMLHLTKWWRAAQRS